MTETTGSAKVVSLSIWPFIEQAVWGLAFGIVITMSLEGGASVVA